MLRIPKLEREKSFCVKISMHQQCMAHLSKLRNDSKWACIYIVSDVLSETRETLGSKENALIEV